MECLTKAEIPCILPIEHPLAALDEIGVERLSEHEVITYAPGTAIGSAVEEAFAAAGIRPKHRVQVSYSLTAFALASRGVGVALVEPSMLTLAGLPSLVSRPLLPRIQVNTMLFTPKAQAPSEYVQEFKAILKDEVRGNW